MLLMPVNFHIQLVNTFAFHQQTILDPVNIRKLLRNHKLTEIIF